MATEKRPEPLVEPAWERQPGESDLAFAAFVAYRDLGPARTAQAAAKGSGKQPRSFHRWATGWGWLERAAAWDGHIARVRDRETERAAGEQAYDWERSRREWMDDGLALAHEMRAAARSIIRSVTDEAATKALLGGDEDAVTLTIRQKKDLATTLAAAATVAEKADAIGWGTINAGIGDAADAPKPDPMPVPGG